MSLRVAVVAYVLRRMGPPLIAAAVYAFLATALIRWEERAAGLSPPDFQTTLYGVVTQLFFQPTMALPPTPIGRALLWITPLVGVFLVVEGVLKIGSSLFDSETRRELWVTIMTSRMKDHVVVCGLGHCGYRIIGELRALGEEVVVIEKRPDGMFVEEVRASGVPVHVGDARRDELLAACGVERAKAVVCATSDDLANIEIALDSKRMNPRVRVVLRMFDQRLAAKVGGALELDQSFSTSALSAPLIALRATEEGVLSTYRLDDETRVTAELVIGRAAGFTIARAEEKAGCRVIRLRPAGATAFAPARADDPLAAGDRVLVDVAAAALSTARAALC